MSLEKSPEALATLLAGTPDSEGQQPPPAFEKSPEAHATLLEGTPDLEDQQPPPYEVPATPIPSTVDEKDQLRSGSHLTCPSTSSLTSSFDGALPPPLPGRPQTPSSCTKFFISQRGIKLRPWPFAHSNELSTEILDASRTAPLFTSTRFAKRSGTCVLEPVYDPEYQQQPVDPAEKFQVRTTYVWGPGNDPVISYEGSDEGSNVDITVRGKGKLTRTRWFEWGGERYEWRYTGRRDGDGMVLQRLVVDKDACTIATPEIVINDEKRLPTPPQSPNNKGKSKIIEKQEDSYVSVAEFRRDVEENKACLGFRPAGQGGWVINYDEMKDGRLLLPHWLVLATCMVMLKRERDRRALQVAVMIGAGAGGGP